MLVTQNYTLKLVALVGAAWLAGYCGYSPAWGLLIIFSLFIHWMRSKQTEGFRPCRQDAVDKQKIATEGHLINFPDFERSDFVNKALQKFWPFCTEYLTKAIFTDNIERTVKATNSLLSDFRFVHIDLGDMAPQLGGLKTYSEGTNYDEFVFDTELLYCGDAEIKFSLKRITAGIKNIQLRGEARLVMKPLLKEFPFIGNFAFYFLRCPFVDFEFTNAASIVDVPGLRDAIMQVIFDLIKGVAVIPNKFIIPILPNAKTSEMLKPNSKGVILVKIVKARNLMKLDFAIIGKSKSDPYVNVYAGGSRIYRTAVKSNTTHPEWNEKMEIVITENETDSLLFELRDEDPGEDDLLGSCQISIEDVIRRGVMEEWIALENASTGEIYLELIWLRAVQNKATFQPSVAKTEEKLPKALLTVFVGAANNLPRVKRKGSNFSDPNPYCVFRVENQTAKSRVFLNCTNPHFSHVEQFLLKHPDSNQIVIKVEDQKTASSLGSVRIPLRNIFNAPNMELERAFHISGSLQYQSTNSTMHIHLWMKILVLPRTTNSKSKTYSTYNDAKDATNAGNNTSNYYTLPESDFHSALNQTVPSIVLSIRYSQQREALMVKVIGGSNLQDERHEHPPDTYVKLSLLPDSKERLKTRVVKRNANPEYGELFEWSMDYDQLRTQYLQITVKSHAAMLSGERSRKLGEAKISLTNLDINAVSTTSYSLSNFPSEPINLGYIDALPFK